MVVSFKRATKYQAKLRLALAGPSGSGKTFSALAIASAMGQRIAVIDTERGSASKYADRFAFDVIDLETFHPAKYVEAIKAAVAEGYDVLVIDSLSHAWFGKDGVLEQVDRAGNGNSYAGWKTGTPLQQSLVDAILSAKVHVIATLRSKTEYVVEQNGKGKAAPRKVGTAPIQRDGMEYEFDVVGELDLANNLNVTKTRCAELSGRSFLRPGADFAQLLLEWLAAGPAPEAQPTAEDFALVFRKLAVFVGEDEARRRLGEAIGGDVKRMDRSKWSGALEAARGALRAAELESEKAAEVVS